MPKVTANKLTMHYEQQGTGDPLILIPYLAADHACYAFQVAEYAKHFTCISIDPRGAGETDKPAGRLFHRGHGGRRCRLHGRHEHPAGPRVRPFTRRRHRHVAGRQASGPGHVAVAAQRLAQDGRFLKAVVEGWQMMARASGDVTEVILRGIFPWCFTPELYVGQPDHVRSLEDFVRSRPAQPVEAFLQQSNAVLAHDVEAQLGRITAPTQFTFGRHDRLCSTRFADRLRSGIRGSEVVMFEECAHAPIYERVEEFNQRTLAFLRQHATEDRYVRST